MLLFVQICYYLSPNSNYNFYDEKQIFALFYKGELCNLIDTNNLDFVMILIAYILAVILKMINKNNKFQHEVRVLAKIKEMKVEEVIKLKYFQFYTTKLV